MKKAALTGLAALSLVDISAATPAGAQSIELFLGNYVGAHAGQFWGDATFTSLPYNVTNPCCADSTAPARKDAFSIDDFLVGVHGGANWRLGTNTLIGVEGDWTNLGGSDSVSFPRTVIGTDGHAIQYRSELEFEWQSTVRGRVGFVAGNMLFFATAGVAFLNIDWSETAVNDCSGGGGCPTPITFNHSKGDTLVGGVVGGGVEVSLTPTIIIGSDYLYESFGSIDSVPHGAASGVTGELDNIDVHKVRVRVSVKFGGPPQ